LFYSLFLKYRDAQLENYIPDIEYSTSDYHHVRPLALTKTYSTRQFPQAKSKGPGRQISRFTVISNVAETEQSYDPFKSSRFQHLDAIRGTDRAKITIHRNRPTTIPQDKRIEELYETSQFSGASASALSGSSYGRHQMLVPPRAIASRSSLASSTRSRNSGRHIKAPIRYKRGVSFAYIRNRSGGNYACASGLAAGAHYSSYAGRDDDDADSPRSMTGSPGLTRYIRSRKGQSVVSQPLLSISGPARASQLWTDDVRQLSSSLARDCDEAFNRSSAISSNDPQRINSNTLACFDPIHLVRQPTTPTQARPISASQREMHASLNNRPLPPPPVRSESVKIELIEARKQAELRKSTGEDGSPGYLDRMVSHIDRLIQPMSPGAAYTDYRASSAPVDSIHAPSIRPLPSICEAGKEEDSPRRPTDFDRYKDQHRRNESKASRIASAPEPRYSSQHHDPFVRAEPIIRNTIRVVNSPSPDEPVQIPAPLTIRKKSSQGGKLPPVDTIRNESDSDGKIPKHRDSGLELRQRYSSEAKPDAIPGLGRIDESDDRYANDSNSGTIVKKKSTWFKRNSKSSDEQEWKMSIGGGHAIHSQPSSNDTARQQQDPPLPFLPKKKGFSLGRLFKRRPSNNDMALGGKCI
jgi:serine/threonine-protein kinase HSL1 (negative regulator of Swe1 kinase)